MRIAFALVLALAAATGCAKKAKPPAAPADTKAVEPAPTGTPTEDKDADDAVKGDPCDGGEVKTP